MTNVQNSTPKKNQFTKFYKITDLKNSKISIKIRLRALKLEIIEDYKQCLRSAIVDYILQDPLERKRLLIETIPVAFPVLTVRAPVPWQQSKCLASHSTNYNLFIGNEILRDIRDLWFSRYSTLKIIQVEDFGELPVPALEFESKVDDLCKRAGERLLKEWLADVAELFLEKKHAWSSYFDNKPNASTALVEKYFRSVDSLLSRQLRIMVMETLKGVRDFFVLYQNGNFFDTDYEDLMFIR